MAKARQPGAWQERGHHKPIWWSAQRIGGVSPGPPRALSPSQTAGSSPTAGWVIVIIAGRPCRKLPRPGDGRQGRPVPPEASAATQRPRHHVPVLLNAKGQAQIAAKASPRGAPLCTKVCCCLLLIHHLFIVVVIVQADRGPSWWPGEHEEAAQEHVWEL